MFAGGYGGNRIKYRIVHHDPVLGLGIRFGRTRMSAAIMPRTALRTVAGMPQRGAKTELSTRCQVGARAMIAIGATLGHAQSDGGQGSVAQGSAATRIM